MATKATILMEDERVKVVDETSKHMGISHSDFVRIAVNEKLFHLGVLPSNGVVANQTLTLLNHNEVRNE